MVAITQVVTTLGQECGIANFARNLELALRDDGAVVKNVATLGEVKGPGLILLHYHPDFFNQKQIRELIVAKGPIVLFLHDIGAEAISHVAQGLVAMSPALIPSGARRAFVFDHPSWVPKVLEDRATLRREFGLPEHRRIIGTSGYLKFERQLPEILQCLLPAARQEGWSVQVLSSPWRLQSPGLLDQLEHLRLTHGNLYLTHEFLASTALNRRLQACNLLWCWTAAPSSPYASGVASDQYASGTRMVAADKLQHQHIVGRANVVRASATLPAFIDDLLTEMRQRQHERHDPSPISWGTVTRHLMIYLKGVSAAPT